MTAFSTTVKGLFIMGDVIKRAGDDAVFFEATSPQFPDYRAQAETMTGATTTFREGLDERLVVQLRNQEIHEKERQGVNDDCTDTDT